VASAFGLGRVECYKFRNVSAKIVVVTFRVNDLVSIRSSYIYLTLGSGWMNREAGCQPIGSDHVDSERGDGIYFGVSCT
jgi:hypothetical protein